MQVDKDVKQEPNEILTARHNPTLASKRVEDISDGQSTRLSNRNDDTWSSNEDSEANEVLSTARKSLNPVDFDSDEEFEKADEEPSELRSILKQRRHRMDQTADEFVKLGCSGSTDASYHSSTLDYKGGKTACETSQSAPVRWELGSDSSDDECNARMSQNSQRNLEWDYEDAFDAITKASLASTSCTDASTTGDKGSSMTSEGSRSTLQEFESLAASRVTEPLIATDFQDVVMQQVRENKAIKGWCVKVTLFCAVVIAWFWGYGTALYLENTTVESTYPVAIIREMRKALELHFNQKAEMMQQEFNVTLKFELNALESKHQDHMIKVLSAKELEHREHVERLLEQERAGHQLKLSETVNDIKERQLQELEAAVAQAKAVEVERWSVKMSQLQKQLAKDAVDYLSSANEMLEAKYEADKQKFEAEKQRQLKATQQQLDELDKQKEELAQLNEELEREKEELHRANEELGRDKEELSKDIEARRKENDRLMLEKTELLKAQGDLGEEYARLATEANSTTSTNVDQLLELKKQAEKSEREKQEMLDRLEEARLAYQKANDNQNNHEFDMNHLINSGLTNLKLDDQVIQHLTGDFTASTVTTAAPRNADDASVDVAAIEAAARAKALEEAHGQLQEAQRIKEEALRAKEEALRDASKNMNVAAIEAAARAKALEEARGEISAAKEHALQDALREKEEALRDAMRAKEQAMEAAKQAKDDAYAKARMELQTEKDAVKIEYEEVLAQKEKEKEQILMAERAKLEDAEKREKLLTEEKNRTLALARENEIEGRSSRDVIEEMNLMQEQSGRALAEEIKSLKKKHQEELEKVNNEEYVGVQAERVTEFTVDFPFEGRLCLWMDPSVRPPTLGSFSPCVEDAWKKVSPLVGKASVAHPVAFEHRDSGILVDGSLIAPPSSPWVQRSANWGLISEADPGTNFSRLLGFADTSELWWRTQRVQLKDRLVKIEKVNLLYLTPTDLAKLPEFQKRPLKMVFQRDRECLEKDAVEVCAGWSENGECEANPAYMCVHCPCSCACELKAN